MKPERTKPVWKSYPDLSRTRDALKAYDEDRAYWKERVVAYLRRDETYDGADLILEDIKAEGVHLRALREAFALDTADRNSRANALQIEPEHARHFVAGWVAQRIKEPLEVVPNDSPWKRAGGGVVCDVCGQLYYDHRPVEVEGTGGPLILTRLCSGALVKL